MCTSCDVNQWLAVDHVLATLGILALLVKSIRFQPKRVQHRATHAFLVAGTLWPPTDLIHVVVTQDISQVESFVFRALLGRTKTLLETHRAITAPLGFRHQWRQSRAQIYY